MNPAVIAKNVELAYGHQVAIAASSFEIPTGAISALIGPNGSGKSTLLNAIAGLIQPIAGSIEVQRIGGMTRRVAYVLQTTTVNDALPVTVTEIVAMGRYTDKGPWRRLAATDRATVAGVMERMAITDLAKRHLTELSGGQRQRVFIAQGLAQDHDILLLDEPISGLDLPSARAIDDVIHDEHSRGCTVVMTTHDLAEARIADHVILLSGKVIASGTPAEVLTATNLSEAYGSSLLHIDGDDVFIDDPHHHPAIIRHEHRDR